MTDRRAKGLIWDAKRAAERIIAFTAGRSSADYGVDLMLRSAVERQFEIVGEALARLRRHAPDVAARIPDVNRIVGFRNQLIHHYDAINDARVWRIVTDELPPLLARLAGMLDEPDAPPTSPPPP